MPLPKALEATYHERTLGWRTMQADHKLREQRFLTLQELSNLVEMSKQTVRYFCMKRGVPYSGFGTHGYFPTREEIIHKDVENGLTSYIHRQEILDERKANTETPDS